MTSGANMVNLPCRQVFHPVRRYLRMVGTAAWCQEMHNLAETVWLVPFGWGFQ